MADFTDRVVIVTGGARGVGRGIAEGFLTAGATVRICGRSAPETLPSADGNQATFHACDVRDPEQFQGLVDETLEELGRLDVLINNAGGSPAVAALDMSPRFVESIIRLNLIAPIVCAQIACRAMLEGDGGSIVNIGSVSAERASPGTAAYGAAKAGLVNATRSLAQEWAPRVRINSIIAGLVRTEASADHYGGESGMALLEKALPMGRMATPEDIAGACLYLADPAAAYVSGAALEVYGGGEPPAFLKLAEEARAASPANGR
jgi:NAD(P)-dependent dehydrogenase (short-subunit alcohol dehydrogenase family)